MIKNDARHNNELQAEGCKVEELNNLLVTYTANLNFELQHDSEMYQKNVNIGEQISILLESENIWKKSLSKQNNFYLDLFRARKSTTSILSWQVYD